VQYITGILRGTIFTNIHAIILVLYSNKYFKAFFYINIVCFIIFKWNIELLQTFIFELGQYTFYQYFVSACKYKDKISELPALNMAA